MENETWSTAKWVKISCLDCGSLNDLLKDKWHRIICRDCLINNEFIEVESEIYQD